MSEFNSTEKMGSEHLASRPLGASPASATPMGRGHHYTTEAPRVLARMPDLGAAETERESQLPSLERDGRLLSSRISVAVLMGGVAVLLLVALVPFVFFGKNKAPSPDGSASWQQPPAPNAPEAPAWGPTAPNAVSQAPNMGGTPAYPQSNPPANPAWNSNSPAPPMTPSTTPPMGWNAEVAARPTTPAWRSDAQQTPAPWGTSGDTVPHVEQSAPNPWATAPTAPNSSDPNYNWNNRTSTPAVTSPDATAATNPQSTAPSWSNPPYGASTPAPAPYGASNPSYNAVGQTPDSPWNTATQASAAIESPAPYASPVDANRPAGPMMPSSPASFNSGYEASRAQPAYRNSYQPQADTNRAPVVNGQNPADAYGSYGQSDAGAYRSQTMPAQSSAQPYNYGTQPQYNDQPNYQQPAPGAYRNDRGVDAQPASPAPYGQTPGTSYNTQPAASAYPSSYQSGYQANPQSTYPAANAAGYPTGNNMPGAAAPTNYASGMPQAEPGVARFQGVIEKPSVRTTYDRTRPSLY